MQSKVPAGLHRNMSFGEYLAIDAVNHSLLRLFSRSAAHARQEMLHPKPPTESQELGQAIHTAVLEPSLFERQYAVAPQIDRRTREGKASWAAFEEEHPHVTVLTADQFAVCEGIRESLWSHPIVSQLLEGKGSNEIVAVWQDGVSGLFCKGKLDRITQFAGFTTLVDLKTTVDAREWYFAKAAAKYHYHSQAAFYLDGLHALAPMQRKFLTIAVEKEPPWCCAVYEYGATTLEQGRQDYNVFMSGLKEALDSGVWPGYPTETQVLEVPDWAIQTEEWK